MSEVITYQNPENQLRAQILDGILATLSNDKLYSSDDLHAAARAFTLNSEITQNQFDFGQSADTGIDDSNPVIARQIPEETAPDGSLESSNVVSLAIAREARTDHQRNHKDRLKNLTRGVLYWGAAGLAFFVGIKAVDNFKPDNKGAIAEAVPDVDVAQVQLSMPEPAETVIEVTATLSAPVTTPETTAVPATTEATTTTSTTTTAPVPATEAPKPLSLSEQVKAGQTELSSHLGVYIGNLFLNELCEDVDVFIANTVNYNAFLNFPHLTAAAQDKVLQLKNIDPAYFYSLTTDEQSVVFQSSKGNPNLTDEQRLNFEDDIQQLGIDDGITGTGDPMFGLAPARPVGDGCNPRLTDTRATQLARGSTEATEKGKNGGFALEYQAVTDLLPEFAALPGDGKVTYIQGHRSTQSAAFSALNKYKAGNIATYTGNDNVAYEYQMERMEKVDGEINIQDLVQKLAGEADGQEWLVLQVCIDGQPNNRALYIFTRA